MCILLNCLAQSLCLFQRHGRYNHVSSTGGLADTEGTGVLGQRGFGISRGIPCSPENEFGEKAKLRRPMQEWQKKVEQPDEIEQIRSQVEAQSPSHRQHEQKGSGQGASTETRS